MSVRTGRTRSTLLCAYRESLQDHFWRQELKQIIHINFFTYYHKPTIYIYERLPNNGGDNFHIAAISRLLITMSLGGLVSTRIVRKGGDGRRQWDEKWAEQRPLPRLLGAARLMLCLWDHFCFANSNRSTSFSPGTHFYLFLLINEYIFFNL